MSLSSINKVALSPRRKVCCLVTKNKTRQKQFSRCSARTINLNHINDIFPSRCFAVFLFVCVLHWLIHQRSKHEKEASNPLTKKSQAIKKNRPSVVSDIFIVVRFVLRPFSRVSAIMMFCGEKREREQMLMWIPSWNRKAHKANKCKF